MDDELGRWMDENEMLREAVSQLPGGGAGVGSAPQPQQQAAPPPPEQVAPSELKALQTKCKELQKRVTASLKERERAEADKVAIFSEMNEAVQKLEAELAREKSKSAKAEKLHVRTREDLALANAEVLRLRAKVEG